MRAVSTHRAADPRLLLTLGFGALAVGTAVATREPATSYEASIYGGTPTTFWVSVAVAMVIAVSLGFAATARRERHLAVLLGGLAMTAVVALPVIRDYHYLGEHDPMTHLGIARDINAGLLPVEDARYPAIHMLGGIISEIGGIELTQALLVLVVVFVVSFFVFIPLVVRELTAESPIVLVGVFAGFLLLQVNFLGVHMHVHPTSQAIMYVALMLYLFIELHKRVDMRFLALFLAAYGTFVMLHPQQGANFFLFYVTFAGVQLIHSAARGRPLLRQGRSVVLPGVALFGIFWLWASNLPAFERSLSDVVVSLLLETGAASEVATRGVSLAALGGSYEEIILRLFLVPLIFCLFAGLLMLAVTTHGTRVRPVERLRFLVGRSHPDVRAFLLYTTAGLVAITALFFAYLVGDITSQYFRHYGFIMVFMTVLGAFAIGRTLDRVRPRLGADRTRRLTIGVVLLLVCLSIPVVYPSPYVYQTSGHVTETQVSGFEESFEYWATAMSYGQTRPSLDRYDHAIHGERSTSPRFGFQQDVPDHFADHKLRSHWNETGYLPVTRADRVRDGEVYEGFRYSESDFRYLETEPGIDKVRANGEFDLYLVRPAESS